MKAPDFSLQDQNGETHSLTDYRGKWLIVYFYPKDDTPGCTKEACAFRDKSTDFTQNGIQIIGISKDSIKSHKKFAEKYHLNFPLLSDETSETIKAFGAWGEKKFMGKTYQGIKRNTYLINPESEIVKKYENVNPFSHVGEILKDSETFK